MNQLQQEGSNFAKLIEMEMKHLKDLEKQLESQKQFFYEKKKSLSTSEGVEIPQLQKTIKQLEYRLEKIKQRHNASLGEISRLYEEVNFARRERVIFDNVFKQLEVDLKYYEEDLKCLIFESMQLENQWNTAQEAHKQIKSQGEISNKSFKQQYVNAFNVQDSSRILEGYDLSKYEQNKNDLPHLNLETNKSQMMNLSTVKGKNMASLSSDQLKESEKYDMIFEKFRTETNIEDINDFIELYANQDDINKGLFEKSNVLIDEIESVESQLKKMKDEIDRYNTSKQEEVLTSPFQQELQMLKVKLKDSEEKNKKIEDTNKNMASEIDFLIQQIPELFTQLGCQLPEGRNAEEELQHLAPENVLQYLAIIEQRSNDIIELSNYLESQDKQLISVQNQVKRSQQKKETSQSQDGLSVDKYQTDSNNAKKDDKQQSLNKLLYNAEQNKEYEKIKSGKEFREEGAQKIQDIVKQNSLQNKRRVTKKITEKNNN